MELVRCSKTFKTLPGTPTPNANAAATWVRLNIHWLVPALFYSTPVPRLLREFLDFSSFLFGNQGSQRDEEKKEWKFKFNEL